MRQRVQTSKTCRMQAKMWSRRGVDGSMRRRSSQHLILPLRLHAELLSFSSHYSTTTPLLWLTDDDINGESEHKSLATEEANFPLHTLEAVTPDSEVRGHLPPGQQWYGWFVQWRSRKGRRKSKHVISLQDLAFGYLTAPSFPIHSVNIFLQVPIYYFL